MVKTYLDILSERGIRPFLTDEAFEELQKFDYKSQYAIPGQVIPVFKHPNQHNLLAGKEEIKAAAVHLASAQYVCNRCRSEALLPEKLHCRHQYACSCVRIHSLSPKRLD